MMSFRSLVGGALKFHDTAHGALKAAVRLTDDDWSPEARKAAVKVQDDQGRDPDGKFAAAGGSDKVASAKAKQLAFNASLNASNIHSINPTPENKRLAEEARATHEMVANRHDEKHDHISFMMRKAQKG